MRRSVLPCLLLVSLLAPCAAAGAATTSTVPASHSLAGVIPANTGAADTPALKRLLEAVRARRTKGRRAGTTAIAPPSTTVPTPNVPASQRLAEEAAAKRTRSGATSGAAGAPSPTTGAQSSSSAAGAIAAQLRALERQGKHGRKGHGSSRLSGPALALAILGAILALAALLWAVLRFAAIEPRRLLSLRHALAEAGFRASAVWSEFTDWARLGH